MTKVLTFLLIFIATLGLAQKKHAPVFVVGKSVSADDSLKIKQLFYEGLKEKTKQNLPEAAKYFKQIIEIDPSNHAVLYEMASLSHSLNQEKEAEKYAREAVTVNSENKWYWLLLAEIYKKTRNVEQLVLVFDELIRIDPNYEDYYYDKANALYIQNKDDDAEKVYDLIEKRFGSSEDLITAKQRVYQKQGNSGKAATELENLISKNPGDVRNYLNLSEIYLKEGNYNKTIAILNKAKALNPNDSYISLALADVYKMQGKTTEAFGELKKAFADPILNIDAKVQIMLSFLTEFKDPVIRKETIALGVIATQTHPSEPKAFSIYGEALYGDRQFDKAKTAYKKVLEFDNQKYIIWQQILEIHIIERNYAAAIADGEEALSLFPNQAYLYFFTALAYSQTQKHEKAVSYLKNASSLEVEEKGLLSQIYSSLGDSYNSLKKFKESDQSFEKALQINPDNAYVLNNYAYYLSLRNEALDKAASMSKRSNELEKDNSSFEDTYAWVLFKQKKYKDARMWMEKALKNNKDNPTQLEHYGDILFNLGEKDLALEQWKLAKAKGEKSEILEKKIYEKKYIE
jgi:tetratricopeptide (TPR) repeat protein